MLVKVMTILKRSYPLIPGNLGELKLSYCGFHAERSMFSLETCLQIRKKSTKGENFLTLANQMKYKDVNCLALSKDLSRRECIVEIELIVGDQGNGSWRNRWVREHLAK